VGGRQRISAAFLDVAEYLLDAHLCNEKPYGWAIIEATGRGGPTVYQILKRMLENDWLQAQWETDNPTPGKPRRRLYRLTDSGFGAIRQLLAERRPEALTRVRRARPTPTRRPRLGTLFGGGR
jgi:PadR family transcriptional regulator PadR